MDHRYHEQIESTARYETSYQYPMMSTYPPVVEQNEGEKGSLEMEVSILRDQLAQSRALVVLLSSRVANLEEEITRKDALYSNTNAAQFVEVEVATPVLHVQARPMIIDSANEEDENGTEDGHASPHHRTEVIVGDLMSGETVSGLAYAHRIAKRGAVKIICQTGSPITAMWMTNEVTCGSLVNLGNWEKWILVPIQGSREKFAFRSSHGLFMTVEPYTGRVTAKGKEINDWSIFTAVELGLSKFAFLSHQGKYLSADPTMKWGKVVANRLLMSKWESFQLVLASN